MALRRWTGTNSGDVSDAGNWDDGAGGAGAVPVANDDVLFSTGSVNVDTNAAHLLEIAIDTLVRTSDYTGHLGTALVSDSASHECGSDATNGSTTSDITIEAVDVTADFPVNNIVYNTADRTWHRIWSVALNASAGTYVRVLPGAVTTFSDLFVTSYHGPFAATPSDFALLQPTGTAGDYMILGTTSDAGADYRVPKVTVKAAERTGSVYLDGQITRLTLLKGDVNVAATTKQIPTLEVAYVDSKSKDVTLVIEAGAVGLTSITAAGGDCTNSSTDAIVILTLGGGTWVQNAGNIATAIQTGGTLEWNDAGGLISSLYARGGVFDATGDPAAKTLTDVELYSGAVLDLRNSAANVAVTNGVLQFGGTLLVDVGAVLDVTYT